MVNLNKRRSKLIFEGPGRGVSIPSEVATNLLEVDALGRLPPNVSIDYEIPRRLIYLLACMVGVGVAVPRSLVC